MPTRRDALAGLGVVAVTGLAGCGGTRVPVSVEILDAAAEALFRGAQDLEQLADGFVWSEGPTWDRMRQCLYFTDVPSNRAYRWSAAAGLETFLDPSGTDPA